jgi:hypothetical protein
MSNPSALVQKLWNYPPSLKGFGVTGCNPAASGRDDGLSPRMKEEGRRKN